MRMMQRWLVLLMTVMIAVGLTPVRAEPTVINAGKGGHNSRNLLKRFDADAAAHKPDLVILGSGTNDAINSSNSVPLSEYEKNVRELIRRSRSAGADVVVITPLPCWDPYVLERHPEAFFKESTPTARVRQYKEVLRNVCTEENVPLVDLYALFEEKGAIGEAPESWLRNPANSKHRDGVHPTDAGYAAIAAAVHETLKTMPRSHAVIVCLGDSITFGSGSHNAREDRSYPAQLQHLLANLSL